MADLGKNWLYMTGAGSNEPLYDRATPDLGASQTARQEASQAVGKTTQSPEVKQKTIQEERELLEVERERLIVAEKQLAREEAIDKAIKRAQRAVELASRGKERELRQMAKETGAWDKDKGFIILDESGKQIFLNPNQFKTALERGDAAAKKFAAQLASREVENKTNMVGVGGNRPADRPGFHFSDILADLSVGNFGGIARELTQPLGSGKWQANLRERSEMMKARGANAGGLIGAGRFVGGRLLSAVPMLATPAAIVAGQQLITRGTRLAQETVREGQVTGGGFGEGLAARREALQLAGNPFDMLSRRDAQQIVSGIRSKGFTGELGRALQDTVGDVFQDLGTDIQTNIEMVTDAVNTGMFTMTEFRDVMRDLDDQAKKAGLSVQTVQDALQTSIEMASAGGGIAAGKAAALTQPVITEGFSGLMRKMGGKAAQTMLGGVLKQGAMISGVPQWMAQSPQIQQDAGRYFDQIAAMLKQRMNSLPPPWNTIPGLAMWLAGPGQGLGLTGGITDVGQIEMFLRELFKGSEAAGGWTGRVKSETADFAKRKATARQKLEGQDKLDKVWGKLTGGSGFWQGFNISGGDLADAAFSSIKNKLGFGNTSQKSMKDALGSLRSSMEGAGIPEDRINAILRDARKIANADEIPSGMRTDLWRKQFGQTAEDVKGAIRVEIDMRPEASRWLSVVDKSRNEYIAHGKNQQYTLPPPPIRGG